MSKKVYAVEYTVSSVVYAETENEARLLAYDVRAQDVADVTMLQFHPSLRHVCSLAELPRDWDGYCIPWGEHEATSRRRTLSEIFSDAIS